jgi:hypothetical protein
MLKWKDQVDLALAEDNRPTLESFFNLLSAQ